MPKKPFKETRAGKILWGIGDIAKSVVSKTTTGSVLAGILDVSPVPHPKDGEEKSPKARKYTRRTLFILIIIACIAEYFGIPAFEFIENIITPEAAE